MADKPSASPPTLTTATAMPQEPVKTPFTRAPELDDSIVAAPLVMPDFINIKARNQNVSFRWINHKAGDGLRFAQAQAQGWVVATEQDIAPGCITPYKRDGGTKYINGDLILMKIDRSRYLGALKYKHQVAAALADDSVLRTISAKKAASEMANAGANRRAFAGKISTFTPDAADLAHTPLADAKGIGEMGRLGHDGPVDMGGSK